MPAHHDVRPKDVLIRRLHGALAAAADRGPADFAELLLVPGVGARTVRSLEKAGFIREGALRGAQFRAGGYHDLVGYSILRSDPSTRERHQD